MLKCIPYEITLEFGKLLVINLSFLAAKLEVTNNSLELRLIDAGEEPSVEVGKWFAVIVITVVFVKVHQRASKDNVSKGNPLGNKVRSGQQIVIHCSKYFAQFLLCLLSSLEPNCCN